MAVLTWLECTRIIQIFVSFCKLVFYCLLWKWRYLNESVNCSLLILPLSDCHFVMKVFAKNNAFSRGSFVHRSHVFSSCEDRGKGSTSFPRLFSFEKFLRKKALEMRLGEGVADPRPYLNLRPNWIPQSRGKLYSRPGPLLICMRTTQASLHFLKISVR